MVKLLRAVKKENAHLKRITVDLTTGYEYFQVCGYGNLLSEDKQLHLSDFGAVFSASTRWTSRIMNLKCNAMGQKHHLLTCRYS